MPARVISAPFATADPELVVAGSGAWAVDLGARIEPLAQALPGWDYATDLVLSRSLKLDLDAIRHSCGLGADDELALTATMTSGGSKLRKSSGLAAFARTTDGQSAAGVTINADGAELAFEIVLETSLVLLSRGTTECAPWTARRPGSVLWSDRFVTVLQGNGSRFPSTVLDLSKFPGCIDAPWMLETPVNLYAPAMGGMRILINSGNPGVIAAVTNAATPEPHQAAVLSMMKYDLARQMLDEALGNAEELDDSEFEDGSWGQVLQRFAGALYPNRPLMDLVQERHNNRYRFEARFSSQLELLKGVAR